jgi:two-component system KDP operon response regulator KdpE
MTATVPGQRGDSPLAGPPPAQAPGTRILIVEDQPQLLRALRVNLRARQYEVLTAATGQDALAAAATSPPDAMILDLGLPDMDGLTVIGAFRSWSAAPIIVLSGRTSSVDKIGALDSGADDYVTKPFDMAELLARLRAALRRDDPPGRKPSQAVVVGRWAVDIGAHVVRLSDSSRTPRGDSLGTAGSPQSPESPLRLTPTEWRILEILLRRPGQLVLSAQLLTGVWGPEFTERTNYLRFHMARLRRKLEDDPARPRHLLTEPGMGYRFQP